MKTTNADPSSGKNLRSARGARPGRLCVAFPLALFFAAALSGCGKDEPKVYRVAQGGGSEAGATVAAAKPAPADEAPATLPGLKWKLPAGWTEVPPGQMRVASFQVAGKKGQSADVSVIPLPGLAGADLANVNRWRGQVGQPEVSEAELAKLTESVQVAGQSAKLFDQGGQQTRILGAILRKDGVAWFFKMTGENDLVKAQKSSFLAFLKSVEFTAPTEASAAAAAPSGPMTLPSSHPPLPGQQGLPPSHPPLSGQSGGLPPSHPPLSGITPPAGDAPATHVGGPDWKVPANWKEIPGGQFLVAKYQVTGAGNAQAVINVSTSMGDGGGALANVNRWRGQLGLAPWDEAELVKRAKGLQVASGKAVEVDIKGTDPATKQGFRVLAAIVSISGDTWFYKMMGDEKVVEQESAAFTKFVQTAKYPNGH